MSSDTGGRGDRVFNPKMGRRFVEARSQPTMRRAIFLRMARGMSGGAPAPARGPGHARARCDVRLPPGLARRCVVKARYVPIGVGGAKAARAHLAYIERDGVERDGSQGRMFDAEGDVRRDEFAAPIEGEKRQFRFIISPEDGDELDLRDYTRRLVERMEKDLGRELRWAAVCHYNTDNPHVHVVVRGVDTEDREVRIDRTYLSQSLRLRAQELATNELGPRDELDLRRQLDREVSQERLTTIDRRLAALESPERTVQMADIAVAANSHTLSRPHALARLEILERLQFAERVSPTVWRLEEGWQDTLQRLGERGDIIKRMHEALRQPPTAYRIFDTMGAASVEGVIRHKGLHDELTGAPFVIVETPKKEAHYVRLDPLGADGLVAGERVRITATPGKWVTAPDQVIQRVAAEDRGFYSAPVHLQQLRLRPVMIEGRQVPPESIVEVNVRRLKRLERYNLVTRIAEGHWKVPPNLVDLLRDRERTHPQHRIEIERLDRVLERGRSRGRGPDLGR
jgi:type IV secretory pathway VirD2 relaxase